MDSEEPDFRGRTDLKPVLIALREIVLGTTAAIRDISASIAVIAGVLIHKGLVTEEEFQADKAAVMEYVAEIYPKELTAALDKVVAQAEKPEVEKWTF